MPSSGSSTDVASTSLPPKLAVNERRAGLHALSRIARCRRLARSAQASARSRSPSSVAMRRSRSQPAQHIAAENVCCRSTPRNSHGPESGLSQSIGRAFAELLEPPEQVHVAGTAPGAGRRKTAPRPGSPRRKRRAASADRPGCRRAPGPCRDNPRRCGRDAFLDLGLASDAVQRLQFAAVRADHDVVDVAQVGLHRPCRAEPVQRLDHEIAVAQPAVSVVPVASAVSVFREST